MRAWNCQNYRECLARAALADCEGFPCPCDQFDPDPAAIRWEDVEGARLLAVAILRPDCWRVFQALAAAGDTREKAAILRAAWPSLGFRRRDIL